MKKLWYVVDNYVIRHDLAPTHYKLECMTSGFTQTLCGELNSNHIPWNEGEVFKSWYLSAQQEPWETYRLSVASEYKNKVTDEMLSQPQPIVEPGIIKKPETKKKWSTLNGVSAVDLLFSSNPNGLITPTYPAVTSNPCSEVEITKHKGELLGSKNFRSNDASELSNCSDFPDAPVSPNLIKDMLYCMFCDQEVVVLTWSDKNDLSPRVKSGVFSRLRLEESSEPGTSRPHRFGFYLAGFTNSGSPSHYIGPIKISERCRVVEGTVYNTSTPHYRRIFAKSAIC